MGSGRRKKLVSVLRWQLDGSGEIAAWLQDVADEDPDAAAHLDIPEKPDDAFVPAGAEFAWAAFVRLNAERPRVPIVFTSEVKEAGMSGVAIIATETLPGRIPFAAIDSYARRYGLTAAGFDTLLAILDKLDTAYLDWERDKAAARAQARR